MGGFKDVSFDHNLKHLIGIELMISKYNSNSISEIITTNWCFDSHSKSPRLNYLKKLRINDSLAQFEVKQKEDSSYIFNSTNRYLIQDIVDLEIQDIDDLEQHFRGIIDDLYNIFMLNADFNFISSFRLQPDRTYYQSLASNKVDKFGGGYIDQILDWNDNQSEELLNLAFILKSLKILYDIKPHRLSGGRFEIKVKVKSRSKWESLADVGFGISQFLPIIVADLQLSDNSTLIMSQPEIHLHPSVQANLGDYLVKQVKERNKNYIVETHSEYLLNRMRLLIVKGEIQPEDVAVYYFENSIKDGSVAHRIEFTKDGRILNAPKGFFETYMIDTMDIALNA
jgi:predicted ATP-dependent endonuclease of OLD family